MVLGLSKHSLFYVDLLKWILVQSSLAVFFFLFSFCENCTYSSKDMLYSTHVPELIFTLTDYLSTKFVSTSPSIALLCPMWDDTTMAWTESSKPIETSLCCDLLSLTFWCWYAVDEIHKFNPKFQTSGFVSLIQESPYLKPNLLNLCKKRWEGLREKTFRFCNKYYQSSAVRKSVHTEQNISTQ